MRHHRKMDQLFRHFLPSASDAQIESGRSRILDRMRANVAVGRENVKEAAYFTQPLNHGDYYILQVLEEGERHGYAILSEVAEITEGATKFGPGTLYTSIRRLLTAGLIEESQNRPDPRINDERRQYYRLSGVGQRVLAAESERLAARIHYAHAHQIVRAI